MVRAWARGPGSPLGSSSWGGGAGGEGPAPGGAAASGSGGGAAGSAPLRRLEPPTRAPASSRGGSSGSSSSSRGHRRCRARHRRPWPQAGSGLGGAGGPLGSAVYAAAVGRGSGAALDASSPDRRPVTSVAGGPSGQPDPTEGVSFSRNENRPGFSGLVGKGSSSRRSGGWGRRRGEGREERKEGREDDRGREARVCAALSGCEACLRAVLRNDAPAVRAEERAGRGFPAFGLGLHRGRREEPWELGDGEARAVAETAAATAALRPSYWSPAPSSGFELGHAPSLGPVSPLTARSLRPSFCWSFSFPSHPSLVPQRRVSGPNFRNRPFRRILCLLPLSITLFPRSLSTYSRVKLSLAHSVPLLLIFSDQISWSFTFPLFLSHSLVLSVTRLAATQS